MGFFDGKNFSNSGILSFLFANYEWIQSYTKNKYEYKTELSIAEYYKKAYEDFKCDFGIVSPSVENPIYEMLGNKAWQNIKSDIYIRKSTPLLKREEYDAFIDHPMTFIHGTFLERLYYNKIDSHLYNKALHLFQQYLFEKSEVFKTLNQQGGCYFNLAPIAAPLDFLSDYIRGMKGLVCDLHVIPEKVLKSCDILSTLIIRQCMDLKRKYGMEYLIMPLHLPCFLNRKDYIRFFSHHLCMLYNI